MRAQNSNKKNYSLNLFLGCFLFLTLLIIPQTTFAQKCWTDKDCPQNTACLGAVLQPTDEGLEKAQGDCLLGSTSVKCTKDEECEGYCEGGLLAVCKPKQPLGGLCSRSQMCQSGVCGDNGRCAAALPGEDKYVPPIEPKLQIPIPGLKLTTMFEAVQEGDQKVLYIPTIAEYAAGLYKYLVSIAGILAGIMIVWAGVKWLMSAGNADMISDAKKKIGNAIIGIILAVGSYVILYLVNPDLVTFKSLRIPLVAKEEFFYIEENFTDEEIQAMMAGIIPSKTVCENPSAPGSPLVKLEKTTGIVSLGQIPYLLPETAAALKKAGEIANQKNYQLRVTTACRNLATQLKKAQENPDGVKAGTIAKPGNSPHGAGAAVDVRLETKTGTVLVPSGPSATQCQVNPNNVAILAGIMYDAGFVRLGIENWHYELPPTSSYCRVTGFFQPAACRVGSAKVKCPK